MRATTVKITLWKQLRSEMLKERISQLTKWYHSEPESPKDQLFRVFFNLLSKNIAKTSQKHRSYFPKTSQKHRKNIASTFQKHRKNIAKTSHLLSKNIAKTSLKHRKNIAQKHRKNIAKTSQKHRLLGSLSWDFSRNFVGKNCKNFVQRKNFTKTSLKHR